MTLCSLSLGRQHHLHVDGRLYEGRFCLACGAKTTFLLCRTHRHDPPTATIERRRVFKFAANLTKGAPDDLWLQYGQSLERVERITDAILLYHARPEAETVQFGDCLLS